MKHSIHQMANTMMQSQQYGKIFSIICRVQRIFYLEPDPPTENPGTNMFSNIKGNSMNKTIFANTFENLSNFQQKFVK